MTLPITEWKVSALVVGPGSPGRLYAFQRGTVLGETGVIGDRIRLWFSDDFGTTWRAFAGGLPVEDPACMNNLTMDYAREDALYASTCQGIYRWTGREWASVEGGAVRIDVDGMGNPWIVNSDGVIYRRERNQWQKLPGAARDISINAAGDAWVVGTDPVGGGFGIYHWTGRDWARVDGSATQLSVGGNGVVYVVNDAGAIFRRR